MAGTEGTDGLDAGRLDLDLHPDGPDPGIRGAREGDVHRASGRDPRAHPPGRRGGGVDRRVAGRARPAGPADGDLPVPRLPAGARHAGHGGDGGDLRPEDRPVRRLRRVDAPRRPRARVPRHLGHCRPGHPAGHRRRLRRPDPRRGTGRGVLLRGRRHEAGRVPRVTQHCVAVEAAGRVRAGEQRLQRGDPGRAGGRERRGRRAARGQGGGLQHARGDRGRRRSGRGPPRGGGGGRAGPGRARDRRWWSPGSTA